jgi:hypothetical protein
MKNANDPYNLLPRGVGKSRQDKMPPATAVPSNVKRAVTRADVVALSDTDDIRASLQGIQRISKNLTVSDGSPPPELPRSPTHDLTEIGFGST